LASEIGVIPTTATGFSPNAERCQQSVLSNPQPRLASNQNVSFHRRTPFLIAFSAVLSIAPFVNATPIEPTAKQLIQELQRPPVVFVPARVGWNAPQKPAAHFSLTLEQYGPQATARAVRASLKAALTPDPVSMGALLFCALALRWMRMRKEKLQPANAATAAQETALPRAA
jgi:hypothetical protein